MMMTSISRHTPGGGQRVFHFNPEAQVGSGAGPDSHPAPPAPDSATTPESTTGTNTPSNSTANSTTVN